MTDANLESPLPGALPAGSSTALYCSGTACEPAELRFVVDGVRHEPSAFAMPRFDMACRRSGFWGVIPVHACASRGKVELAVEMVAAGGRCEHVPLGRIAVTEDDPPAPANAVAEDALIAICMGTFDPDPGMFRAQIESIRAQTDKRWVCVISDDRSSEERYAELCDVVGGDERFTISRSRERIGFYRNFERSLQLAPLEAQLIALSDQDDVWRREKLAVLRAALGSAILVYSDLRLVDERGIVLRETLWKGRANNYTNIGSMLIANTVTGASALFRREVAGRALPFPDSPGIEFHDHWLALVALACGELAYVDRALYDYVQHPGAILGKVVDPQAHRERRKPVRKPRVREWRAAYFLGYVPGEIRARTLLMRCGDRLTPAKRRGLDLYLAGGSSLLGFVWFVLRPLRMLGGRTETLGGEWELAVGILWRHLAVAVAAIPRWPDRWTLDTRFPDPPRFEQRRLRRWRERL